MARKLAAELKESAAEPKDPAIYVRTTPALKKVVTDAGNEVGESERWVVERLIESFVLMNAEGRRDVLQGRLALDRVSHLVTLISVANHAFAGRHHTWAIECYSALEKECIKQIYGGWEPPKDSSPEVFRDAERKRQLQAERSPLRLFARYRRAFSWSELSLELRQRAMSIVVKSRSQSVPTRRVREYFAAATHAAKQAVALYQSIDNVHPGIALICYNTACCAASTAMLLLETALQTESTRDAAVTALFEAVAADDPREMESAWEIIGDTWRKALDYPPKKRSMFFGSLASIAVEEINEFGSLALSFLSERMTNANANTIGVPWPDPEYFPYKFWGDTDIVFLRTDSVFKGQYDAWAGSADDDWLLKSYHKVVSEVTEVPI